MKLVRTISRTTLAETLRSVGYQTGAFTANPYLGPGSGLDRGFDQLSWGNFTDCSLRKITKWISKPYVINPPPGIPHFVDRFSRSNRNAVGEAILDLPIVADVATRFMSRVLGHGEKSTSRVAPWIEKSVESWLANSPATKPVFCFVNLLDAHEPYVGLPERIDDLSSWLETLLVPQRSLRRDGSKAQVERESGEVVRRLYRAAISILDKRLESLFEIVKRTREWENTCIVVTSDHGQAFGEGLQLFHRTGVPDAIHRVPLIVKPARGLGEAGQNHTWTSLTQLPSIISKSSFDDESLVGFVSRTPRVGKHVNSPAVALSLSERLYNLPRWATTGTKQRDGKSAIVGYSSEYKVVVDVSTLRADTFRMMNEGVGANEPTDEAGSEISALRAAVVEAAVKMRRVYPHLLSDEASNHLRRWGYD